MEYNCTIKNEGALGIPYALQIGDKVLVEELIKDNQLHRQVSFITGTLNGQICVVCKDHRIVIKPSPDLTILFHTEDKIETTKKK